MNERALDGVEVLDLGQVYHGPYASLLLAYLGADVIKIEPPFGEQLRNRVREGEEPAELVMMNSSKRGITLNLKTDRGKDLFKELVYDTDVIVENFSTGTMERLGLGYDALSDLNPALIYAHGSGFGVTGPYAEYPAMDLTIQAMSGVMAVTGYENHPPVKAGIAVGDFMGGVHLAAGVLAALYHREHTGEGQFIEEGMLDSMYPSMASPIAAYFNDSDAPERTGNRHSGLARCPYNVYAATDGHVAIYCTTNDQWTALLEAMGRTELATDERFETNVDRVEHMETVDALISSWTRNHDRDELVATLLEAGVPTAPVKTVDEVIHDPQLSTRNMSVPLTHPSYGDIRVPGLPVRLSNSAPPSIEPAPTKGRDNRRIFQDRLGLSDDEFESLASDGVI